MQFNVVCFALTQLDVIDTHLFAGFVNVCVFVHDNSFISVFPVFYADQKEDCALHQL